jgi:beta-glucosidase
MTTFTQRTLICTAVTSAIFLAGCSQSNVPNQSWRDINAAPEERATALLAAMTLEQKQQQLVGNVPEIVPELPHCFGARHVRGIAELGIPTLRITNGPVGIGQNDCVSPEINFSETNLLPAYTDPSSAKATALPSAMAVAASFDTSVAETFAQVIADEANALALHVFEAPGMNLARIPVLGRNFEYYGEDPYLSGVMSVAGIKKVQSEGVIAMAKHFAANEQETNRNNIAQSVPENALHELYLLPFEMSVKDGEVASLMCSYNDLNGNQACENPHLLTDILRDQWGFKGYVQSDFFAVKSTSESMKAGLDHLMPMPLQWAPDKLNAALDAGELSVADIDQALHRRYTQMFKLGIFARPLVQTPIDVKAGGKSAYQIGTESSVLLQNNGALPFSKDVQSVVLIGKRSQVYAQQAVAGGVLVGKPMGAGGGSSDVVPHYTIAPIDGIKNALASLGNTSASVELILVEDDNSDIDNALQAAKAADAVIIMAGTISEEGADRITTADEKGTGQVVTMGDNLDWYTLAPNVLTSVTGNLPRRKNNPEKNSQTVAMVKAIMAADENMHTKTALVLKDNAGVAIPMHASFYGSQGPAILETWFPGQEDGNIAADLLFGINSPSGKLPVTFPLEGRGFLDSIANDPVSFPGVSVENYKKVASSFPGVSLDGKASVEYKEGLNIGYRWYDANVSGECSVDDKGNNPCVAFPFGYGLSYTTFTMGEATLNEQNGVYTVSVNVSNSGEVAGAEVVQVYVGIPSPEQPPKRLVGFNKVQLEPGESKTVSITIDPSANNHPLGVYNIEQKQFVNPEGEYAVYVGNSSSMADLQRLSFTR